MKGLGWYPNPHHPRVFWAGVHGGDALPALGPASATMNADAKNAYAQAQTICAAGTPTNAVAAGVDILAVESALLPYLEKATALAPDREIGKRRVKFGNVNLGNLKFGE